MRPATPDLYSKNFDQWAAAVRPRLELSFFAAYRISAQQAAEIVDETLERAREFWDVVSDQTKPHIWAYKTAMKIAEESGLTSE